MKPCPKFISIREDYQRAIEREEASATLHEGTGRAETLTGHALVYRRRMAAALNGHLRRCRMCG